MPSPVLLVELVAVGRFTLDAQFPYLHAALKRRGLPSTWLRFALPPDVQYARGEDGIGLDAGDLAILLDRVAAERAGHLVFSHRPAPGILAALGAFPALRHRVSSPELGEILAWLGCAPDDAPAAGALDPDFGFVAANAAAREMAPTAFVRAGTECAYRRSVLENPAYAGVDLSACRTTGCAFCATGGEPDADPLPDGGGVEGLLRQIAAFLATHPLPDRRARPALRVSGYRALREVRSLAEALAPRGWPPLDLLLDARTDQLVALAPELDGAATALRGGGHRLHVCLVGVESFSATELERMNKGVTPAVNLAAVRVLRTLEARHPGTFRFREHGGLSTILYTPWTSLDDLALNLAVARHFDLDELLGKLLTSRLRLYPGLAMSALAARDGLLADGYADPALDTARRNFYARELPWRFLHPEVEAVNRVTTRLQPDPGLRSDPLFQRVQRAFEGRRPLDAAAEVVARAIASPGAGVDELLRADAPGARVRRPAASAAAVTASGGSDRAIRSAAELVALQRAGINRVNRLESLPAAEADAAEAWLARRGRAVVAARLAADGDRVDLFFGGDAGEAREAADLTRLLYSGPPSAEVVRARRRIGELFGYPACCAARFSTATCSRPTLNEWLVVQRRAEHPEAISPLVDPFHPVNPFVPCSFACEAALARARRAHAALRAELGDAAVPPADGHPRLFLLDRPGHFATLLPRGPVERSFEFEAAGIASDDPRLRALAGGGTIRIDPGAITVERAGARVASFHLDAAVFWAGGAFDPDLWLEAALQVLEPVEPPRARDAAEAGQVGPPAAGALAARVRAALAAAGDGALAGYAVRGLRMAAGRVLLTLGPASGGVAALELYVEPLAEARHCYRAAGDLAITFASRTPIASAGQRRAVAALAALLSAR